MGENFMSAMTQIQDLVEKKKQISEKVASLLSEAISDRIANGNLTRNTEKDIYKAIEEFPDEERIDILVKAIVLVGMNKNVPATKVKMSSTYGEMDRDYTKKSQKRGNRSDIFGSRY